MSKKNEVKASPSQGQTTMQLLESRGSRGVSSADFPRDFPLASVIHMLRKEHNILNVAKGGKRACYVLKASPPVDVEAAEGEGAES